MLFLAVTERPGTGAGCLHRWRPLRDRHWAEWPASKAGTHQAQVRQESPGNFAHWLFGVSLVASRYYFPTYENDTLLCTLSDSESDLTAQERDENVPVISEDTSKLRALKRSSVLNQLLLQECLEK